MSTTQTLLNDVQQGVPSGNYDGSSLDFASDAAAGPGYYQGNAGTQTVAVRVANFDGRIQLQGTLDCLPGDGTNWVSLAEFDTSDSAATYTEIVTVTGQFVWIRARVLNFLDGTINSVTSTYAGAGADIGGGSDVTAGVFSSVTANAVYVGTTGVVSSGNITAPYFLGNGSQLTGITGLDSFSVSTLPPAGDGALVYNTGNGVFQFTPADAGASDYGNANVVTYAESGWAGNIVPATDDQYSLGNATNQWSELWVSNSTIYIGGVPVAITGNVLTVNGEPVLSNDSNSSITTTGNITADYFIGNGSQLTGLPESYGNANVVTLLGAFGSNTITTTGNITANSFIGDGSQLTGLAASYGNANVAAYLPTYGGNIRVDRVIGNTTDNAGYLQWQGNSSGDLNGYTTLLLVPDDTLVANDQYLIIDPTDPYHIHIRAGGTQDASQAELFLGGEANFVRVQDGTGVRLQNLTRNDTVSGYSDPTDFNTGTWYESAGTYFVQYTTADAGLIDVTFQFNDDNENILLVYYNGGATTAELTSAGSVSNLGGGVYRVSVNEAPPANPTTITELAYTIWTNRTNSVELSSNDFTVSVTDDIRITGRDTFSLRNESATEPITIRTDYNGNDYVWEFDATGNLTAPGSITASGDITVAGDITGTASASTLVLAAEPNSNTAIQLNDSVDSGIRTVANLEISTDVSNTARTWRFDTNGDLQLPTSGDIIFRVSDGEVGRIIPSVSDGDGLTVQAEVDLEIKVNDGEGGSAIWSFESDGRLYFPDDTFQTTAYTGPPQDLTNGNTSVRIPVADGSVVFDVDGFVDIMDVNTDGLQVWGANANVDGNLIVGGYATITGNVNAANLIVSESLIGSDASPQPTISGFSTISATGNITGGNIITAGRVSASGNILALNFGTEGSVQTSSVEATGNITGGNIITAGSVNVAGNVRLTGAEATDTARIFADVAGSTTSLVLEVGDDDADSIVLRHYSFAAGNTIDMLTATRVSNTTANVSVTGNFTATGNISGNTAGYAIGYRDIPQISFTGNATIATTDAGKHYYSTESTDYILTIADNTAVSWPVGTAITVVNRGTGNITVAQAAGVSLYLAGNSSAGNRTVTTYGMVTVLNVAANVWMINGTGVT